MRHADLLERLLEGDALPQDSRIGEDVPEELDRLAMLADLVSHAAEPDPIEMRAEARSDLRTTLIREANLRAAEPPPLLTRIRETVTATTERWAYSSRAAVAGGTAAMVLSTGGVAAAANGSLPGDLFYDLKLAAEDVALSFADAGVSRGEGLLQQATTRVEEAHTAAERQQAAAAAAGLRLADEHTRDGAQEYLATYLDTGDTEVLQEEKFREIIYVFDYLWKLRFFNQIEASAELRVDSDELDIDRLTEVERDNLQSVLSRIPVFQTQLSYDFLGVAAP